MKFLVSLIGASGLLAALVAAAPLEKRVYVYTTETVVETVDVTVTVTATGPAPTTSAEATTTPAQPATTSEPVRNKAQDVRPTSDAYTPPAPPPETTTSSTTSSVAAAPTTTSTTSSTPSPPPPEPTTTSTSSTPPPPPPPPSTTSTSTPPAYTPPAPSTTSAAPTPVATASNTVSGPGGACSASQPCEGELTHYDTLYDQRAYGACGGHHDGRKEYVVALSHLLMGPQSNGNPVCGKYISITYKGVTEKALVVDKCMGCAHNNVDLSESLFQKFAPLGDGRLHGARWHFTS